MKNVFKVLGIIALVAVIGFSMAACGDDDGGGGGSAFLGDTLELSGQVYTMTPNSANYTITYTQYKGNLTISDNNDGSVIIKGGKFSYTIETPNNLEALSDNFSSDNVTVSDPSVKCFSLSFFSDDYNTGTYYDLMKANYAINGSNTSATYTQEIVHYMYVDKDVTISGKGKPETAGGITFKTNNFSLALKKGWNAVYQKTVGSYPATSSTATVTTSLKNPSLKWVLIIEIDD